MKRLASISILGLCAALSPSASAAPATGPMAELKSSNERIDHLLKQKGKRDEVKARQDMKDIVNGFLDYDELAKRSLSQHWDVITRPQRDDFVATLKELIEKNYVKQLRTNLEYEVAYKNESVTEGDATVSTVVKVRTKGKSTDTGIDYKMKQKGAKWMVYDVITDDVSMVKNYRSQFNKIITNESFDALVKKMKKRAAEIDETKADGGKPGDLDDKKSTASVAKDPDKKPVAGGKKAVGAK